MDTGQEWLQSGAVYGRWGTGGIFGVLAVPEPEHPDFSDTERVGNILWSIVKGYAGIVVVLNFVSLISTPLGMEGSLVLYPMLAACYVFFIVTTIDLFKPWGQKLSFNAVKASRNPEIIAMEYKTSPVADRKDLYG